MKSNFKKLFEARLEELKIYNMIDINLVLDDIMPEIKFEGKVTKAMMAREIIKSRLTSAFNAHEIYACEKGKKGHFVYLNNADEDQLSYLIKKAKRDVDAAKKRKEKAEKLIDQISMAWDAEGNFIGLNVPKAVGE